MAAGVRAALIYWHFKDKADLFNAMMGRATLPMEQLLTRHRARCAPPPWRRWRRSHAQSPAPHRHRRIICAA
ncbi:MAG: TetR family transcriptional regulator [Burkholderiaceae bacterium]